MIGVRSATFLIMALMVTFPQTGKAASAGITYHGRLLLPNGRPVSATNVQFRIQIRTPPPTNCLLYEEFQTKDLSASQGVFSLTLNDGSATTPNTEPYTLDRAFQNRGNFHFAPGKCGGTGTTYEPGLTEGRQLAVSFNDGSFGDWEPLPTQGVNFVPLALESVTVGGYRGDQMLRVEETDPLHPIKLDPWAWGDYQKLLDLVGNTSISGGNASIGGTASGFTGVLSGDVTGGQASTKVEALQGRAVVDTAPVDQQVLTWNHALSRWEPRNVPVAGAPDWSDITNRPTSLPPSGGASGDLTGNYPSPTIADSAVFGSKIADGGVAFNKIAPGSAGVSGQVLHWGGASWSATKLNFMDLVNAVGASPWPSGSCNAGEAIVWQSVADGFQCAPIAVTETDPTVKDFAKVDPSSADFSTPGNVLTLNTVPVSKGGTGATTAGAALNNLLPDQSGETGKVLQTNGVNASWVLPSDDAGITSINGASGAAQTFTVAQGETAPVFSTAGNTHTLNIPLASGAGVTSGTISHTDYQNFSSKQTALGFTPLNPANNLSELASTTTARTNLGLGTAATKNTGLVTGDVVEVGAGGKIPLSLLPSIPLANTTGVLPITQGGTGAVSQSAAINALLPSQTSQAGKILQTDGTNVSWVNTPATGITALTGEVTASGSGSVVATIANNAVTSAKILDGTIATADLADGAVSAVKIADNGVTTAKIADGAVTDVKIDKVSVNKVQSGPGLYLTYAPNGAACANGEVLKKTANGWECGTDSNAGGTVTSVTSANADISVTNTTTTPVMTLNVGTGPNQILKLDASSRIPAVNGSLLTNLNASSLATGTVATARLGSGTADNTTFLRGDGAWAPVPASGLTSLNGLTGGIQTFATPGTTGNAPNWSSVGAAHTLNIPMASAASVTAGLISKTDYDAFSAKQAAGSYLTALTGDVTATGPGSATATIANNAITTAKIADNTILATDLDFGGVNGATSRFVLKDSSGKFTDFACATTGHVPTWTVTGFACQAPSITETDPKVGANTPNMLSKWNGTALVASGVFESGGNVGIGTTSPSGKLDVRGSVHAESYVASSVSSPETGALLSMDGGLKLYRSPSATNPETSGYIDFRDNESNDSDARISWNNSLNTSGALVFSTSLDGGTTHSPRMVLNNLDGYVGIGTTNPQGTFHVAKSGTFMSAKFGDNPNGSTDGENGIGLVSYFDGNNYIDSKTHSGKYTYFRTGQGAESGATRTWMSVQSATGNVGIGTAAPGSIIDAVASDPVLTLRDSNTGLATAKSRIRFAESRSTGSPLDNFWEIGAGIAGTSEFRDLAFRRGQGDGGGGESFQSPALMIASSGNVGVGTTAPTAKLDVSGKIRGVATVGYGGVYGSVGGPTSSTTSTSIPEISASLSVQAGDLVKVDLACNLSNTVAGGTTYMRSLPYSSPGGDWLQESNWITVTSAISSAWSGGFSTGLYRASADGTLVFRGYWHVSSGTSGYYTYCNIMAFVIGKQ